MSDLKRDHQSDSSDSSDDDFGPSLADTQASTTHKPKRTKTINPASFLSKLPNFLQYSQSFMHRDTLTLVATHQPFESHTFTRAKGFLVTGSIDGRIKFWKKTTNSGEIEFVKEFLLSKNKPVKHAKFSLDGRYLAVTNEDEEWIKVFDVQGLDMVGALDLGFVPDVICFWKDDKILVSSGEKIFVYDIEGELMAAVDKLHKKKIEDIVYNPVHDCVVSVDILGMIEYWIPQLSDRSNPSKPPSSPPFFELKSSTNLYDFRKSKTRKPTNLNVSPNGKYLAVMSFPDRKITLLNFLSGKIIREYDENLETLTDMHRLAEKIEEHAAIDDIDFGKRIVIEKEIETKRNVLSSLNILFDESSQFVLYPSLSGIKLVHIASNKCSRIFGTQDGLRFTNIALLQGTKSDKTQLTVEMAASDNLLIEKAFQYDSILFATAYQKPRFYTFTQKSSEEIQNFSKSDRDAYNETSQDESNAAKSIDKKDNNKPEALNVKSVTLHTTLGDITLVLYPQHAPLAVENFVTLCNRGYYDHTKFHRVIKKFMIQGGDPEGDGTGGESMWGGNFKDEFTPYLRHDKPFTLSMANHGPGTNGSQFFITCAPTPWLNDKHTVFGRVMKGMDVVKDIENLKTEPKTDRPVVPPEIMSTSVLM